MERTGLFTRQAKVRATALTFLLALLLLSSCLPKPPEGGGGARQITLYGFSIM